MIEERETQVSQRVSQNMRALRQHNRWTMARLSAELGTLGFKMSAAVINHAGERRLGSARDRASRPLGDM